MTDLTPSRLRELLAAATPGPWIDWGARVKTAYGDRNPLTEGEPFSIADCDMDVRIDHDITASANAALIALAPALAARVIEQDAELERLRLAGKHLAIKLAEFYRMGNVSPAECQAMRDWMALMPPRAALTETADG